jgi:predicted enzyme related to lactoylglutathione lyase
MGRPIVYVEVGCPDREANAAFYAAMFDWSMTPGQHSTAFATDAGRGIDGHVVALGHEPQRYTMFYVAVEDLEASISQAESLGGRLLVGPLPIEDGRFAWIEDPAGNTVGLLEEAAD